MGCQKAIAAQIVEQEADYMLAVKDNHPTLAADLAELFTQVHDGRAPEVTVRSHETNEKGHGRIEKRMVFQAILSKDFL